MATFKAEGLLRERIRNRYLKARFILGLLYVH